MYDRFEYGSDTLHTVIGYASKREPAQRWVRSAQERDPSYGMVYVFDRLARHHMPNLWVRDLQGLWQIAAYRL